MVVIKINTPIELDRGRATLAEIAARGRIESADLIVLREEIYGTHGIGRDIAEALFALERNAHEKCAEWTSFFVEAITDHLVWHTRPTGIVNTPQAEWLIAQADRSRSLTAFAAMVNVLAEAHRVPAWLPAAVRGRALRWAEIAESATPDHAA